MDLIVESNHV
ncbi:hypothetical protein PFTANZ_06035 [Plasmodium falciparum Tanzania (2000708)]|uniref:Uncharacterized protein n=1 Tax=Plasmodium falciparum Tanzania (2000708) TaxID=1036725 RepID=A0A024VXS5_PLAFA|nr:hypothetical protein PFTANZ_06035 [Plasmodium falciparum Tanzania (2000708)]